MIYNFRFDYWHENALSENIHGAIRCLDEKFVWQYALYNGVLKHWKNSNKRSDWENFD